MSKNLHSKLAKYLESENLSQQAFGKQLGVSQGLVHQWLTMSTRITAERAVQIETVTKGKLSRYDCRPDLYFQQAVS
jgi:DNA-binding transcriptional regulator YdaS (Cro superfamily)